MTTVFYIAKPIKIIWNQILVNKLYKSGLNDGNKHKNFTIKSGAKNS